MNRFKNYNKKKALLDKNKQIVAKVSYYVYDKKTPGGRLATRSMSTHPNKTKFQKHIEMQRDDLRSINERKPISRPIVLEGPIKNRTSRTIKRKAYDSISSDSSDDYVTLGKKLTTKYKVDKIPRPATKYLAYLGR